MLEKSDKGGPSPGVPRPGVPRLGLLRLGVAQTRETEGTQTRGAETRVCPDLGLPRPRGCSDWRNRGCLDRGSPDQQ